MTIGLLYGGIDSDGITERAHDLTSVMAGVAKRHAVQVSCLVVMRELFLLPESDRRLFAGVDRQVTPRSEQGTEESGPVRNKLVELYDKLLGIQVTPHSPDVDSAYRLFVEVMELGLASNDHSSFPWWHCDSALPLNYFDGLLNDVVVEREYENGWQYYDFDWDRVNSFMHSADLSDPHRTVQSWVVVLAYLLMDYRYLYL